MSYELVIYEGGTAVLTDADDAVVWASDADDEFAREFDELLTIEDADDIAEYLEDSGYLPEDAALDIIESDDTGLHEVLDDEDDDDEDDDDEDDDE